MEIAVIVLIIVAFLVASALNTRRKASKRPLPSQSQQDITPAPRVRIQAPRLPVANPESLSRFDASRSEPTVREVEITGAAYVVDGDTITINKTQVRLFGIDAPELDHPYGKKAKWALVSLCKGKTIRARITATDDHGRTVAKCYLPDGTDLSEEMVKLGMAIDWPKFSGGAYRQFETDDARKKLWLADARQKGRLHVWEKFEANRKSGKRAN